jgi:hypothetical protein
MNEVGIVDETKDAAPQAKIEPNELLVLPAWAVTKLYQYVQSRPVAETGHLVDCFSDIKRAQITEQVRQ